MSVLSDDDIPFLMNDLMSVVEKRFSDQASFLTVEVRERIYTDIIKKLTEDGYDVAEKYAMTTPLE